MKIGLIGLPGSGKTTVFNALTGLDAGAGTSHGRGKTHLGVVKVPDRRVDALARLYQPKKKTYAEVTFSDIAAGEGSARGLDRSVLTALREADALCQVVRAFESELGATAELAAAFLVLDPEPASPGPSGPVRIEASEILSAWGDGDPSWARAPRTGPATTIARPAGPGAEPRDPPGWDVQPTRPVGDRRSSRPGDVGPPVGGNDATR